MILNGCTSTAGASRTAAPERVGREHAQSGEAGEEGSTDGCEGTAVSRVAASAESVPQKLRGAGEQSEGEKPAAGRGRAIGRPPRLTRCSSVTHDRSPSMRVGAA